MLIPPVPLEIFLIAEHCYRPVSSFNCCALRSRTRLQFHTTLSGNSMCPSIYSAGIIYDWKWFAHEIRRFVLQMSSSRFPSVPVSAPSPSVRLQTILVRLAESICQIAIDNHTVLATCNLSGRVITRWCSFNDS